MTAPHWLRLAAAPATVRRALGMTAVVGPILIAINHGDAIVAADISGERLWKMLLTLVVPYVVSTVSSMGAVRQTNSGSGR